MIAARFEQTRMTMNFRQILGSAVVVACATLTFAAEPSKSDDAASRIPVVNEPEIWKNPSQTPEARAADLTRRMSLVEKASQIEANPPAIPRLGIHAYSHRNECL